MRTKDESKENSAAGYHRMEPDADIHRVNVYFADRIIPLRS